MQQINPILAQFEDMLPQALEESKDPDGQRAAFEALCECGLPHRKVEAWKYTDTSAAVAGPFVRPHHGNFVLRAPDSVQLKMIDRFPVIGKNDPFALLSRALSHGGLELIVPPGIAVDELVEITLPAAKQNQLLCPALVLHIGAGSKVDFVIRSPGQAPGSLVSLISQVTVEENASVSLTKTRGGDGAFFGHLQTRQAAGSQLQLFEATAGGELTRNDLHCVLEGEGAQVDLHGLYVISGQQHADNHTTVEHAVPNTGSRQLYKGIMDGHAVGVFNGRIVVNPGASGTDALQMNRNLLRSRGARIDTKPQLEIGNDDVRCSHGATVGRLDETAVFYLESRGLDRSQAEGLLARGFVGEVIELARNEQVRNELAELAGRCFEQAGVTEL
jgi:Fe-S cluster assembly protein SufD